MRGLSPELADRLKASRHQFVVTGVGGWLGTATLEMLDSAFKDDLLSRVKAYASYERVMRLSSGRTIPVHPLGEMLRLEQCAPTYVLHYAYLGKEKVAELGAVRFTEINQAINDLVDAYCARLTEGGLFFASSGAAHYANGSAEDASREPYGAAKLRDEARFLAQARPNFAVSICRIFNMAGPFINKLNDYALSSILLDILGGGPIKIRANRRVMRSFVHVRDIIEISVRTLLERNAPVEAFETAGEEIIEVAELARRAAHVLGRPNMRIVRPDVLDVPEDRYVGNGTVFRALAKDNGITLAALDEQIADTAAFLRSTL